MFLCSTQYRIPLPVRNLFQSRLKTLDCELRDMWESVRLRERQYHVCKTLIKEAEAECDRCQDAIEDLCEDLQSQQSGSTDKPWHACRIKEGGEEPRSKSSRSSRAPRLPWTARLLSNRSRSTRTLTPPRSASTSRSSELSEIERTDTWNEVAAFELEHTHWGRLLASRCQEKASVKKTLDRLMKLRRNHIAEKVELEEKVSTIATEIPMVVTALQGPTAEVDSSLILSHATLNSAMRGACADVTTSLVTPAQKTRRVFEREGWNALTLEEQQWVTVDQAICPDRYQWLRQLQQEVKRGTIPRTKPRKNPAVDQCRYHQDELVRILAEPFGNLNRREMHVRKLLSKFHDDPQLLPHTDIRESPDQCNYGLAQRARLKSFKQRSVQERDWVSVDKIMNPQARYGHFARRSTFDVKQTTSSASWDSLVVGSHWQANYLCCATE